MTDLLHFLFVRLCDIVLFSCLVSFRLISVHRIAKLGVLVYGQGVNLRWIPYFFWLFRGFHGVFWDLLGLAGLD